MLHTVGLNHKAVASIEDSIFRLLLSVLGLLVVLSCLSVTQARAVGIVHKVHGKQISIDDADRILRARMPSVGTSRSAAQGTLGVGAITFGCASSSTQPPEIVTVAASLKCDLDLIFEYVYNNIEYEPLFGSNKGALGTLLDQRGNDIDQAQLFVALLNAAGITQTSLIYGYITLTGTTLPSSPCTATSIAPAPGWLGVKNDGFEISNVFNFAGIPNQNLNYGPDQITLACIDVAHVWVQVTINGTNYVFDPSFKQHLVSSGLPNLGTILGYSQSQFLADAGGTIDSVSISNINRSNIRADLTRYANNLINYIQSNNPAYTLLDVIGGKKIIPLSGSPIRQTSLPYLSNKQPSGFPQNWGAAVPNAYRTCFTISMPGVAPTQCGAVSNQTIQFFSDQTYGQRITIFSVPSGSNFVPTLLINGAVPSNGQNTGTAAPSGAIWNVPVCVLYPVVGYGVCETNPITDAATMHIKAGGSYLLSAAWGGVSRGMVQKHRQMLAQALAAPGANPSSEPVLGESLAVIGYNYYAEITAQHEIGDVIAVGKALTQYDYGLFVIEQTTIQQTGSVGPLINGLLNVYTTLPQDSLSPFSAHGAEFSFFGFGSSSESTVLEQTQAPTPNMVAVSTIKLVDINAGTGAKTFFADGTTASGQSNYINLIRPALQQSGIAYSAQDLANIDVAITGASPPPASPTPTGGQALAPVNGNLTVGLWRGAGYMIVGTDAGGMLISGDSHGGASGTNVPTDDQPSNTNSTILTPPAATGVPALVNPTPAKNNTTISEPIDAVTGAEIYTNTDLVIGSGSFPYALPFARTYTSSSNLTDIGLGNGWTHSYSLSATVNSDPYEGMGASSPIRAAAAIAAIYVSQDLLTTSSTSAQFLTLAWLVNRWMTDQLTNNAVLISRPDTTEEFIALPQTDGQAATPYNPPLGSAVVLTGTGTGSSSPTAFTYVNKDHSVLTFAPITGSGSSAPISTWTLPIGMQVNFSYNNAGNLTAVTNTLGRSLTLSYSGTHITGVSNGIRSVTYGYAANTLTSATDPLSNQTIYAYDTSGTYDTAGHLTQVFYPTAPGIPFVTNFYDGLGRVSKQLNANQNGTLFYFAGSRTETADAAGDRHVTYQTPRNKITKDASLLSSSFGDVFNDTPQQNGIINVTSTQYDGLDRPSLVTLSEGGTTGYTYDTKNNVLTKISTPKPGSPLAPQVTTYTYDQVYNKPTSITDPLGLVTSISYDGSGNLLTSISDTGGSLHLNARSSFTYNSLGKVLTATNPLGIVTQYTYDSFGNRTSIIRDAGPGRLNQLTSFSYSSLGDVISVTDPRGNVTNSTYDGARRLTSITSPSTSAAPNGLVTSYSYDPNGQLVQTQQSANSAVLRSTSTSYTLTGKPATTTDANNNTTTLTYDAVDRLARVTDPMQRIASYGYDAVSRQVSISNPAIQATPLLQQSYTPDGLLASLTDANNHATTFAHDGLDRLATTTYPDSSTENLGYDVDNNILTRRTRAGQTITYTYDTLNRLSTKTPPAPAAVVSYDYDLAGHVVSVSDTSAAITAPVCGALATMSYSYDALNRLTAASFSPVQAQAPPAVSTAAFSFAYNAVNQRVGQSTTDNSFWAYPAATTGTVGYTANNLNQYTAVGSVSPTYDGNGNLTFNGNFTYCYDTENRLIAAINGGTCASPTTTVASYVYDAQGRRKSKTVSGTTTVTVTDPANRALLDYDGTSGAILRWYAFGLGLNDVLNQTNVAAGTRTTFIPDIQGSIVATLASGSGTLTKTGYFPYGTSPGSPITFGFTGQAIDPETNGLYYFRARHYSPAWGRFLQVDPIGYAGGSNLYGYVNNDPLNLVDPQGFVAEGFGAGFNAAFTGNDTNLFGNILPNGSAAARAGAVGGFATGFLSNIAAEIGLYSIGEAAIGALLGRSIGVATEGGLTAAEQLAANRAAGSAFEQAVGANLEQNGLTVGQQITIETQSGVRTRLDFLTQNPVTGAIGCIECKASLTAPLTRNQTLAFPEIGQSGGTIIGAGKPGFPGGLQLLPTAVQIFRGP